MATWKGSLSRAGRRLSWPRLTWKGLASGAALVLAALVVPAVILPLGGTGRTVTQASPCGKAVGPFTVHGTKVLAKNGSAFISYGMTISGLQEGNWTELISLDLRKIVVTAQDWCANTIRIQLNQDLLLGPNGTGFNQQYMAAAESEIALAESYNLVVVINDETNFSAMSVRKYQNGPTPGTEVFWKDMTRFYGHDPQVIFDLFNEPRTFVPGMSSAEEWRLWLDGGTFKGVYYPFGMAQLASYVRSTLGARNLFWIEGPRYSLTFEGMVSHHALLHVSDVVYAIHHAQGEHDLQDWNAAFGYLVADGIAPVVNGEFTNYEPLPNPKISVAPGYCWANAPTAVPEYLRYLASLGIGMSAYQLVPGWLIKSNQHLNVPTSINPATWSCVPNDEAQPYQSAGALIMAYFKKHNG